MEKAHENEGDSRKKLEFQQRDKYKEGLQNPCNERYVNETNYGM